jgi:hypothetical protein
MAILNLDAQIHNLRDQFSLPRELSPEPRFYASKRLGLRMSVTGFRFESIARVVVVERSSITVAVLSI